MPCPFSLPDILHLRAPPLVPVEGLALALGSSPHHRSQGFSSVVHGSGPSPCLRLYRTSDFCGLRLRQSAGPFSTVTGPDPMFETFTSIYFLKFHDI